MARRSSGSGWGVLLLIVIGLFAAIPKEFWIGIVVLAGVAAVVYAFQGSKPAQRTSEPAATLGARTRSASERITSRPEIDPGITAAQCWVPPGHTVEIKGHGALGGMLYFGKGLGSVRGFSIEPALINPNLPVAWPQGRGDPMPYWPSYSDVSPSARGEYLQWLIGGRKDPSVQLGCVFLFFYGLERRLLHDIESLREAVRADTPHIIAEVTRLLSVYAEHGSFRRYALSLFEVLKTRTGSSDKLYQAEPPEPPSWRRTPFAIKLALGQVARDGAPLPARWAYSWLMHDEMTFLRTPATRCAEEFRRVFTALYNQRYGQGVRLPINKTKLKLVYRPASASFAGQIEFESRELPDVTVLERPIEELRALANEATDALDSYSRFVGRNPAKRGSMDAIVLLPPVLWPRDSLISLGTWLRQLGVEREMQATSLAELMRHFPSWGTMNKDRAAAFAAAVEHFGVGMEPDVRWGGPLPSDAAAVVLFSIPHDERGKKPSAVYTAAALTMHLAASVSGADGLSPEEETHLEESVERMLYLQTHERLRLRAHTKWLLSSKPSLTAMKKRVADLDESQRAAIGSFVVDVAHVEGGVAAAEMKALAKVYRLLGLPEDVLYRDAHAAAIEPVTVKGGVKPTTRFTVPRVPAAPPKQAREELDGERIARLREESARVSALLGAIFTAEERSADEPQSEEVAPTEPTLPGLDVEHSRFAKLLLARASWTRAELEDLAADRGIMLHGALERINEAFFEKLGEPALEGEDPIEINQNVVKELEPA